jgi:putative proteasome-type protease
MVADTRTNAGLDNISTFRKLHVYTQPGERIMALASAGNLSLSQSVRSTLTEGMENAETGETETLMNAPTMFQAAQRIGHAITKVQHVEGKALAAAHIEHDVSFLFGGQIKGGRLQLFMIYSAGNFIECTIDTPYLQIGEHKYGKPVLDRAVGYDTDLYDALKIGLISMDSTMRSNRPSRRAPGCLRRRGQLPDRTGRALFPGFANPLVGGLARRPHFNPASALSGLRRKLRKLKFYKEICDAVLLYIYRRLTEPGELPVLTANWPSLRQNESE